MTASVSTPLENASFISIENFFERMDHELKRAKISLLIHGYKIDGQKGIKAHCKCNDFKSVDYFYNKDERCLFIEFSDLELQMEQIKSKIAEVKSSDLSPALKREIVIDFNKSMVQELSKKYQDSYLISKLIGKHFHDVPNSFSEAQNFEYHVIISPILDDYPIEQRADLSRYFEQIKDRLTMSIPKEIFGRVRLYELQSIKI